jgi:hypothetical protein
MLRMLRLLILHPENVLQVDQLRILDFFYLFPHLLGGVPLMKGQVAKKNKFAKRATKYNRVASPKMLMMQIAGIQSAALQTLGSGLTI